MLAVELFNINLFDGAGIQAINVDTITIWMRTRNIKGFDPAGFAEEMVSRFGIKTIHAEVVGALKKFKVLFFDN